MYSETCMICKQANQLFSYPVFDVVGESNTHALQLDLGTYQMGTRKKSTAILHNQGC